MGGGMSKVVEGLYLGNIRDSEDRENLRRNGVTHIVSVHNGAKPLLEDMTYLCISASDSSSQNLLRHFKECIKFIHECRLAGGGCLVHCTTVLVAYLMTVTQLGWEGCLAATKAARSYVSPNVGFQQQLREYEETLLPEYRAWIRRDYGRNPFKDQEELERLLSQKERQPGSTDCSWLGSPAPTCPLPSRAGGTGGSRRMNR
ncbi:dual specificity protein phosphatase 22-A-like isoform 2-T3 [Chlamydotis macqueenii]